jgi:hypothetical protein
MVSGIKTPVPDDDATAALMGDGAPEGTVRAAAALAGSLGRVLISAQIGAGCALTAATDFYA